MPVGLSDGTGYPDNDEYLATTTAAPYKGSGLGPLQPKADVEDRTNQSLGDMLTSYVGEQFTMDKLHAILQHPMASVQQTMTANLPVVPSELGNSLGLSDLEGGLKAPAEPADALKSTEGTGTPGEASPTKEIFYHGPYGDITSDDIDKGIGIAMSFGAGTMQGVKSKLLDKNALAHAQIMEMGGSHPDDIYTQTGSFRGADNRWRQEIDDSKATLNPDAFDHHEIPNDPRVGGETNKTVT